MFDSEAVKLLESADKKIQLIPESNLDKLILKNFLTAKVGCSLLVIPTIKKLIVGRIDFEDIEFNSQGIAETFIHVEPYNIDFYRRLCSGQHRQYNIQFWLAKHSNFFGTRIDVYWQINRSAISPSNQQGTLPRLPIITPSNG